MTHVLKEHLECWKDTVASCRSKASDLYGQVKGFPHESHANKIMMQHYWAITSVILSTEKQSKA